MGRQPPPRTIIATRYLPGVYDLKIRPVVWSTERRGKKEEKKEEREEERKREGKKGRKKGTFQF